MNVCFADCFTEMGPANLNITAAWLSMICGALSGALLGLFFHNDRWLGGYGSFRRRLLRLGHISFFGLAIVNLMFAATLLMAPFSEQTIRFASAAFIAGNVTMPLCCFLAAWRKPLRHLFPVPVISLLCGFFAVALPLVELVV